MEKIRFEKYDEQGNLMSVDYIDSPTQEELIAQKEVELLAMYNELKALKGE